MQIIQTGFLMAIAILAIAIRSYIASKLEVEFRQARNARKNRKKT